MAPVALEDAPREEASQGHSSARSRSPQSEEVHLRKLLLLQPEGLTTSLPEEKMEASTSALLALSCQLGPLALACSLPLPYRLRKSPKKGNHARTSAELYAWTSTDAALRKQRRGRRANGTGVQE